jgi:phage tail P2-like protein
MDLKDVDLLSLQTSVMKTDPTIKALCAALTPQFKQLANEVKLCMIYSRVDELDEVVLDELAWQMHIDWYDATADIEIKRKLIKTAPDVQAKLGTPAAVEDVILAYFGDGQVLEWWEYGGTNGMLNVLTTNGSVTDKLAAQFARVIEPVKRKSQHLDQVIINLSGTSPEFHTCVVHVGDFITV